MKTRNVILLIITIAFFIGCMHRLEIKNLNEYYAPPMSMPKERLSLGVSSPDYSDPVENRYATAVVEALQKTGRYEKVIYPYYGEEPVDVTLNINVHPTYSGKGSNFFVNWPGFAIFAPAIWGYGYSAEVETVADLTWTQSGKTRNVQMAPLYHFRQAEIDRTWTEVGWLEVSIIPFIGGLVFTQYDPDVTDEFIQEVYRNYGEYVAGRIAEAL